MKSVHPKQISPIFNCVTPDSVSLASLTRQLLLLLYYCCCYIIVIVYYYYYYCLLLLLLILWGEGGPKFVHMHIQSERTRQPWTSHSQFVQDLPHSQFQCYGIESLF